MGRDGATMLHHASSLANATAPSLDGYCSMLRVYFNRPKPRLEVKSS